MAPFVGDARSQLNWSAQPGVPRTLKRFSGLGLPKTPQRYLLRSRSTRLVLPAAAADTERCHVHLHARSHGRGDRDAIDVVALGARGLGLVHCVRESLDVLHELVLGERSLADARLQDA